jgi:hypothetical protein
MHPSGQAPQGSQASDAPVRTWRELATNWRVWLCIVVCFLVATIALILGYDWEERASGKDR